MNIVEAMSYIGFLFILPCVLVGAYIILRWGMVGVACIWSRRDELDEKVKDEVRELTGRPF